MSFHNVSKKKKFGGFVSHHERKCKTYSESSLTWDRAKQYILKFASKWPFPFLSKMQKKQDLRLHFYQKQLAWTPSAESIHFSIYALHHIVLGL